MGGDRALQIAQRVRAVAVPECVDRIQARDSSEDPDEDHGDPDRSWDPKDERQRLDPVAHGEFITQRSLIMLTMLLLVFAFVLFTLAALGVPSGRFHLIGAGLACYILSLLLGGAGLR